MNDSQNLRRQLSKIAKNLVGHEKRLSVVERTAQAKYVSITDGSTTYYDNDGNPVVVVGKQPDGVYTTQDQNGPALLSPSAAVCTSEPGVLNITWDGLDQYDGALWPSHFKHVEVHVFIAPGYTPTDSTQVATFNSVKGGTITLALAPTTYYVKLVAVNTSGVESAPSVEVSQDVAQVPDPGIKAFRQDEPPTGLGLDDFGSIWYDTNDDNKQYFWDGAEWVPNTDGSVKLSYDSTQPTGLSSNDRMLWMDPNNGYAAQYWNGSTWMPYFFGSEAVGFDARDIGGILTAVRLTPPSNPLIGDIWYNASENNRPERWDGTQWVVVQDLSIQVAAANAATAQQAAQDALTAAEAAQATADGAIRTYYQATRPWPDNSTQPDSALGDMWYDDATDQAYRWNGTIWKMIEDSSIAAALAAAQSAQTTADGKINSYYSATPPTLNGEGVALSVDDTGDLWFETDNGNKQYYWDGDSWEPLLMGLAGLGTDAQLAINESVKSYVVEYAVNSSETVAPTSGWSTAQPTRTPGTFVWFRTTVTRNNNTTATTSPALLTGNTGATGAPGTPAATIDLTATTQILSSPSGGGATTPTTSTVTGTANNTTISTWDYSVDSGAFSTTVPAGVSRTGNVVTITGSTMTARTIAVRMGNGAGVSDTLTVAKTYDGATGSTGNPGADAYTVLLSNEAQVFSGTTTTANAGSASSTVIAYKGTTLQTATIGTITGQVTGLTTAITNNNTTTAGFTVTVTTALTQQSGTLTVPVTVGGIAFTKTFAWSVSYTGAQGATGAPAATIDLTATSQVLAVPAAGGATNPTTSTVTGTATNTTITAWTYSVDGAAFSATVPTGVSRTGNVVTITGGTMTARTIAVRMADANGVADTLTVAKISDGATGGAGADAYTVLLTNEAQTFAAGTTNALAGSATTTVVAYKGNVQQTATVGTITGGATGISAAVTNNGTTAPLITFTVTTALATPTGTFTIPVTTNGVTFNQVFSWSLAFTGATGQTGAAAGNIDLTATTQVLAAPSGGGATTPATATVTGTATNTTITVYEYSVDGGSFSTTVPTGASRTGNVVTITGGTMTARTITVRMADAAGIADTLTVAKTFDGAAGGTGGTGPAGADAYTVLLTNESHTFPGSTNAANAGSTSTQIIAYKGAVQQSATIGTVTGQVTGLTTAITNNGTTTAAVTVTVTTSLTQQNGQLTIPVTVDGQTFTKRFSWAVAYTGATGATGAAASTVDLTVTSQALAVPAGGGATTPATSTITGTATNTTISTWDYSVDGGAFSTTAPTGVSRSTNVVTITGGTMTARTIAVRATGASGVTDTVTVAKISDGAAGGTGGTGPSGYTVLLSNEAQVFAGSTSAALAGSATTTVLAYQGSTAQSATIGTITGQVSGLTTAITNNGTTNATVTVTVTTSLTQQAGTLTIPVTVNGVTFTKSFAWSVSYTGAQGATGVSVTAVTPYFAQVTTGAAAPAQPTASTPPAPWSATEPTYVANTELYRVEKITYSNSTYAYTSVYKSSAYAAAVAAMAVANTKITTYTGSTDPAASANEGDLWLKPETAPGTGAAINVLYRRTSGAWVKVSDPSAQQAISDAAAAANLADGKMKVFAQTAAPTGLTASDNGDLWIDTDDGNKMYRYVHGSTAGTNGSGGAGPWISVLDTSLASIQYVDQQVTTSANGKNKVTYSTGVPGTTANLAGDSWFQYNGSNQIIGQWRGTGGTSWTSVTLENSVIATLDAGKINTGFLDVANRIQAGSIAIGKVSNLQTSLDTKVSTFTTTGATPTTPTALVTGDIWIHTNAGITKIYRATAAGTANWVLVSDDSALPTTFVQSAIPTSVAVGDVWVDTDDGKMYRAAAAGATTIAAGAWILFNDPATSGNKNFAQGTVPTSTLAGDIWVDTANSNKIYVANAAGVSTIVTTGNGWYLRTDLTTKTKTFFQSSVPTSLIAGDSWVNTGDNNKLYVANAAGVSTIVTTGNGWYLVQDAVGQASAARTGAVSDLQTLWGHPSNTTFIDGGDIYTDSIRARSLLLMDVNNYLSDPNLIDPTSASWALSAGASIVVATGTTPGYMIMNVGTINTNLHSGDATYWATEPGTEYSITGEYAGVATNTGTITFTPSLVTADNSGGNNTFPQGSGISVSNSTTWTPFSFSAQMGPNAAKFKWYPFVNSATLNNKVWVRNVKIRRKSAGSLLVDGAIDGKTITGATIQSSSAANTGLKIVGSVLTIYDASNNARFVANGSTGDVTIVGKVRTGFSGKRVEIGLGTSNASAVEFYSGVAGEITPSGIYADPSLDAGAGQGFLYVVGPQFSATESVAGLVLGRYSTVGADASLRANHIELYTVKGSPVNRMAKVDSDGESIYIRTSQTNSMSTTVGQVGGIDVDAANRLTLKSQAQDIYLTPATGKKVIVSGSGALDTQTLSIGGVAMPSSFGTNTSVDPIWGANTDNRGGRIYRKGDVISGTFELRVTVDWMPYGNSIFTLPAGWYPARQWEATFADSGGTMVFPCIISGGNVFPRRVIPANTTILGSFTYVAA